MLHQASTNAGRNVAWATKFCTVAPNTVELGYNVTKGTEYFVQL
jgi:hypothetical protein